jgi:hypothetical protein
MSRYFTYQTSQTVASELVNLYTLEELAVLRLETQEAYVNEKSDYIRAYKYEMYDCVEKAFRVKVKDLLKQAKGELDVEDVEEPIK